MRLPVSLAALCLAYPALAAEIEAPSRIVAVTLYPDAAQATRALDVDLPAGASRIMLRGLPASLDPSTLQVAGEGAAAVTLVAVDVLRAPEPTHNAVFDSKLRSLQSQREAARVKAEALAAKLGMIKAYADKGPPRTNDKGPSAHNWSTTFDVVGKALEKTGEETRLAREALAEIDGKLIALKAAAPPAGPRGPALDVALDVDAPSANKYSLTLTYRLHGARWTPAYEARLTTGEKGRGVKLELVRRASVSQSTGEDWNDIALSLAAFPAASGATAPVLQPQKIEFLSPVPMAATKAASPMVVGAGSVAQNTPARLKVAARPQMAQLDVDGIQALFQPPGKITIASNGTSKLISLSAQTPSVDLVWKTAPTIDPRAFLSAHFTNAEEAPLLAGPVMLFRDGAMIGQGKMDMIASQESADLGFGPDERVAVTRRPVRRQENEPSWYGSMKTETREFNTVVRNLHDFPINLLLIDQAPYSENNAITVELMPQTDPPSDKDPDGKRGLLNWRLRIAPGDNSEVRLAYRIKWPADRQVFVPRID